MITDHNSRWTIFRYSYIFVGYLHLMKNCAAYIWIFLISLVWLAPGCETFDKPEPLPVYLDIDQTKIALNKSGSITTTLGVKDLWIDYGPSTLGVFRQPSVIPVIPGSLTDSLAIAGGIYENGLSSTRSRYPFWRPHIIPLEAAPLDTMPIRLTFEYYPDTVIHFAFNEAFEGASVSFEDLNSSSPNSTTMRISGSDVFMGSGAGRVEFSSAQYDLEMLGTDFIPLPQSGINDIYIEITYKNNIAFTAGLFYSTGADIGEIPAGVFFKSEDEWNTVYIHVNSGVRGILGNAVFKPYISASSFDSSTGTGKDGFLLIDNFRIIHFK
ncbi:MAG: hypothetical protein R3B93_19415 [Bacteroidia bacterium]